MRLLEETGRQIIMATHSSEIVAEADAKLVTLIERTRKHARRADDPSDLELLSKTLGTAFNLRLARALRSRVVLFVEGQDMTVLRRLAKTLEMTALSTERGVTVIPLEGYSRQVQVGPFAWLCRSLLPEAIKIFVVLDHDYRSEDVTDKLEKSFAAQDIVAHVWRRKELESYLLTPSVIARISRSPGDVVAHMLEDISLSMEGYVFGQMLSEQIELEKPSGKHVSTTTSEFKNEFDQRWQDALWRLYSCPAKDVLSELNQRLRDGGYRSVSVRALASEHRAYEIPPEMIALLRRVEETTIEQS